MFGLFKKRKDESPLAAVLRSSEADYCVFAKDVFDHLDLPTRAHVLVGYMSVTTLVTVLRNEAERRGQEWSIEGFILECAEKQPLQKDQINSRRYAWFMWAAMLYKMREASDGNNELREMLGEVWCDIARAAPLLKSLLPDNVVWKPEEKTFFDLVIHEDSEDLVIWAIKYGQGGVSDTNAVQRLANEYDTIDFMAGGLCRTPESLRPKK